MTEMFMELFQFNVLMLVSLGVLFGLIVGCLPGFTSVMGVSLGMSFTFGLPRLASFGFLIGLYVGSIYGGSISAILIGTPGTPSSAATVLDGNALARKGQAGRALGFSLIASIIGGLISAIILATVAPRVAQVALSFGAPEYFAMAVLGLSLVASIETSSTIKALISGGIGFLLSTVGVDIFTGRARFTFGVFELYEGIPFVPAVVGLFAISQILGTLQKGGAHWRDVPNSAAKLPTFTEMKRLFPLIFKSSILGTGIGILPGVGATIGSFLAYNHAKETSRNPEQFGHGSLEGLVAPEAANSAVTGGALMPMLTLGVPGDPVTAVLMGALLINGLRPGPMLFIEQKEFIFGIYAILILSNLLLLLLGLLLIKPFARLLGVKDYILTPIILLLSVVGSYAVGNDMFYPLVMIVIGVLAYILKQSEYPLVPMILGLVLGPIAEENLRRGLALGGWQLFFTKPLSLIILSISFFSILFSIINFSPVQFMKNSWRRIKK